jgi:Na+/H+-dicarboxylate symporter
MAQGEAPPIDTPFSRLRERLDARETGEGEPGPVESHIGTYWAMWTRFWGPLAKVPFPVWAFGALFLGIGLGFLVPQLAFLYDAVSVGIGGIVAAAPFIIFFTLTPALIRMYATASAGRFALVVVIGFVVTTTLGGLFALLVSLVFFPGMGFGFGTTGLAQQVQEIAETSLVVMSTNPLFRAIWGALVVSVLLYFGGRIGKATPRNPVSRGLRAITDIYVLVGVHAVAALGRVIKALMPVILFMLGVYLFVLTGRLQEELAAVDVPNPPWTPIQAYFISVGILVLITFLWLALVSLVISAYTKFPLKRLIGRYLLVVYPFAWATSSSAASIPVNITSARDGLGVRPEVRNFVIPFGATVNLDGTMMAAVVGTIVTARMVGYDISVLDFLLAMIPLILITIGTPGVPGGLAALAGPVMAAVLPLPPGTEAIFIALFIALLFGPNDMFRTAVNVLDNGLFALLLDKWYPAWFAPGAEVNPWLPVGDAPAPIPQGGADAMGSSIIHMGDERT